MELSPPWLPAHTPETLSPEHGAATSLPSGLPDANISASLPGQDPPRQNSPSCRALCLGAGKHLPLEQVLSTAMAHPVCGAAKQLQDGIVDCGLCIHVQRSTSRGSAWQWCLQGAGGDHTQGAATPWMPWPRIPVPPFPRTAAGEEGGYRFYFFGRRWARRRDVFNFIFF